MKKKLAAVILAMMMIFSAVPGVFCEAKDAASENGRISFGRGDAKITLRAADGQSLSGKKFVVYKLFDAENAVGMESINYTFYPPFKNALQATVGKRLAKKASSVTEYEVIDYIRSLNHNETKGAGTEQKPEGSYSDFRYFIEDLRDAIREEGEEGDLVQVSSAGPCSVLVIDGLAYGYYLVDEVTEVSGADQAASLCIVNTANPDAAVTVKSDYPSVTKKIQEDDDRETVGNDGWNDIADYEIGQIVPYRFESELPDINGYSGYYYAWHDVMDGALTFQPDSVCITISDSDKSYTLKDGEFTVVENPGQGDTFLAAVEDIKAIADREFDHRNALGENTYGQKVTVEFQAVLSDRAAGDMGRAGYENDVRLEFSNDPDSDGAGKTGFTPWDSVVCFTYRLCLKKTNDRGKALEGAGFRLYEDEECTREVFVKKVGSEYNVVNRDSVPGDSPSFDAAEMVSDADGVLVVNGLDSGTYYLKETRAPAGYRRLQDAVVLTIDAVYADDRNAYVKGDAAADKTLKSLSGTARIRSFLQGAYEEKETVLAGDAETGAVNLTVVNVAGTKLPVTGTAAALITAAAGAGLLLFVVLTKKREKA